MDKVKLRDDLARIIYHEHSDGNSLSYDQESTYQGHTVDARLSADAILHHYFVIRKPKWLAKRYKSD